MGFELKRYESAWGNGEVTVTVLRGNDWDLGPITVDYATSDLTAQAGQDYQAVSGTLVLEENETVESLTIPILRARPTNQYPAYPWHCGHRRSLCGRGLPIPCESVPVFRRAADLQDLGGV